MKKLTPIRIAILALTALVIALLLRGGGEEPADWPHTATETAQTIPLSRAWSLLTTGETGLEAAILGDHVFIRDVPDAARLLEDTAPAETQSADAQTAGDTGFKALLPYPSHDIITDLMAASDVPLSIEENGRYRPTLVDRLFQLLPIIVILAIVLLVLGRGGMKSLGLNASYEIVDPRQIKETFESVAGIDAARAEVEEIVGFLKDPAAAARLGGEMPKGAIFSGPPGTGKTLLARALAGEANVPFMTIDAAGINQFFVGAGSSKIKRAFREARKIAPCIVFIDEIDAMGRARGGAHSGASDEKETSLNALLTELDGFSGRDGVFVVAATNRPEILDPALTRRGRIDRHVHVDLPDIDGREEILGVHAMRIKSVPGLQLRRIAETTFRFSGADLRALVNEAALAATRAKKDFVELSDFAVARDRLLVGLSARRKKLGQDDRRKTALHEGAHALMAGVLPDADPIEKATILPQGPALGYIMQSPAEDRLVETRDQLLARIRVGVAGRIAEEIFYGQGGVTSGAASDIEAVTRTARAMVTRFGMSDLGFVALSDNDPIMAEVATEAMREIRDLVGREYDAVQAFLTAHRDRIEALAEMLLAEETVDGARMMAAVADLRGSFSGA